MVVIVAAAVVVVISIFGEEDATIGSGCGFSVDLLSSGGVDNDDAHLVVNIVSASPLPIEVFVMLVEAVSDIGATSVT